MTRMVFLSESPLTVTARLCQYGKGCGHICMVVEGRAWPGTHPLIGCCWTPLGMTIVGKVFAQTLHHVPRELWSSSAYLRPGSAKYHARRPYPRKRLHTTECYVIAVSSTRGTCDLFTFDCWERLAVAVDWWSPTLDDMITRYLR